MAIPCDHFGYTEKRRIDYGSWYVVETYCRKCGKIVKQETFMYYEPRAPYYDD